LKVRWTREAENQLQGIYDYIARDSREYALQTVGRLIRRSKQIAEFPYSGRMVPELEAPEIREFIVGSYRLIYTVRPEAVFVVALFHGAQEPPWGP
jgi:plasmid stabilization system protein ParE